MSTNDTLSTWTDLLATLNEVPVAMRTVRRGRGLGLRGAAQEIGVSFATVSRVERGEEYDIGTLRRVLAWLHAQYRRAAVPTHDDTETNQP
jgi:transcriptional regulator with XRE-family HTH domain